MRALPPRSYGPGHAIFLRINGLLINAARSSAAPAARALDGTDLVKLSALGRLDSVWFCFAGSLSIGVDSEKLVMAMTVVEYLFDCGG